MAGQALPLLPLSWSKGGLKSQLCRTRAMRTVLVIGIGTGHPGHMTVAGIEALGRADTLFIPTKGEEKGALAQLRRDFGVRYMQETHGVVEFALPVRDADAPYLSGVDEWHEAIADAYEALLSERLGPQGTGALLVWGDPGLYDSTLRILQKVRARGRVAFAVEVIPGITAIQALTAAFAIPLNRIGAPVLVTTGRRLEAGWPAGADSVVVLLDGREAFRTLTEPDLHIHWGAYLGTEDALLIEGPLEKVAERISAVRAMARARHGWIMDTYLLRKG